MHQGAWLVWATCGGLVAMATTNPFYLLPLFAAAWFVHSARRIDGPGSRSFRCFVLFGALTICTRTALVLLGPVNRGSVVAAMLEGLRVAVMLAVFGTFSSVTDPWRILRSAPRRFHEPALAAALALSIAPRTIEAAARVREAQRMRGIELKRWRALPALAVPVLATGMDEAVTLAESMDARGHGRGRRSSYRTERWSPAAWATAATAGGVAAIFVALGDRLNGDLTPSTFPLVWPEASPLLVVAALSFVLPGALPSAAQR
ncbi:MAG: energy-coupling factor transporter transmembrane protein EcfT [Actinomycetota bacterium]|nr:energy-coupling factor transporter transmembrane protein EcfT [Actinomycetota bacterium]